MPTFEYPEAINTTELQVWNNAAFDNEESESLATAAIKVSWSDMQRVYVNQTSSESLKSDCSKENFSPAFVKSPVYVKSSVPVKPLQTNGVAGNSHGKPLRFPQKPALVETCSRVSKEKFDEGNKKDEEKACDERKIDLEIEELEKEISRLSTRLKSLRLEKAEQNAKTVDKRGRIIPAKFLEPKQTAKNLDGDEKLEESSRSISRMKSNRRGLSLGPSEIFSGARRTAVSLGPSEIVAGIGSRRPGKLETTPVQQTQTRRKSCFWKLQDIDEIKVTREKGNSLSVSPKSRKTASNLPAIKQGAATTVGCKRPVKKEDAVLGSIQPKRLFKDGEKSAPASSKKPLKPGRVIASRYNQISNGNSGTSDVRKRSLPENSKEEESRCEKRLASSMEKPLGKVALSAAKMELLPRIRTTRCGDESPRDSGPAKRVAELIGKKPYFCHEHNEEVEQSVCQALSFAEEDEVNETEE